MATQVGLVYRSVWGYKLLLRLLYGAQYREKYSQVARQIPPGSSIVDLCCGDCVIAPAVLAGGGRYLGLDINERFVRAAHKRGWEARLWDANKDPIPEADFICIQSSLYQFIPHERDLLREMYAKARRGILISEPVVNVTQNGGWLGKLAEKWTSVGGKRFPARFSAETLQKALEIFPRECTEAHFLERETLYVVRKDGYGRGA